MKKLINRLTGRGNPLKNEVDRFFEVKQRKVFKRKTPTGDKYPFDVIDPYRIFDEDSGYESLYLVGDNWLDTEKPIALLFGFNSWKFGFIADYLPEYRVAFMPRKAGALQTLNIYRKLRVKPACLIAWGYTDGGRLERFAKITGLPLKRMEDGFIRSSSLGASHSTPYSLVLDGSGFYYNCYAPSDIENLLNDTDFDSQPELLAQARTCIELITGRQLSKYNPAELPHDAAKSRIKTRKRIAVLGQVDGDASIRYGNPDGWTSESLVKLARFENPDAEVLYRPHPEIYKGYQKSGFKAGNVSNFARVVSPAEQFVEFLKSVDHVYTISSLSGFEALIRGIKVTTVGAPFYSGWGVTDDRVQIERRKARHSIESLFAGAYLLYPRYLADIDDSYLGLKASCLRILGDRQIEFADLMKNASRADVAKVLPTEYGAALLFSDVGEETQGYVDKNISQFDYQTLFGVLGGELYHALFALHLMGRAKGNEQRNQLLNAIREYLSDETLERVLARTQKYYPGHYIYLHYAWLLERSGKNETSLQLLGALYDGTETVVPPCDKVKSAGVRYRVLQSLVTQRRFDEATEVAADLCVQGSANHTLLMTMADVAGLSWQSQSAFSLARLAVLVDLRAMNKRASSLCVDYIAGAPFSSERLLEVVATDFVLKPERVLSNIGVMQANCDLFGNIVEEVQQLFFAMAKLDVDSSLKKVSCYLEMGELELALRTVERLINAGTHSDALYITYSKVLSALNRYDEALAVISRAVTEKPTSVNVREKLRLLYIKGYFAEALQLISSVQRDGIETASSVKIPALQGVGRVREAYDCYLDIPFRQVMQACFPGKFRLELPERGEQDMLVMAAYGPGDELRFASIYNDLGEYYGADSMKVTCERRLLPLMQRSFPQLSFVPVTRIRSFNSENGPENYDHLPASDLCSVLDNSALPAIDAAQRMVLVTDLISLMRPEIKSFASTQGYIKADPIKTEQMRQRLPEGTLVGLSWRSSLVTYGRSIHYLTADELGPLFEIPGLTFVNLQYDGCDEELAMIEARYPGRMIHLDDLDQYNDFDGVAALMSCLDLIVSPATSVVELAGALGLDTWLLSNSAELHWRKTDSRGTDIWHPATTHIEGDTVGDKATLIVNLKQQLEAFSHGQYRATVHTQELADAV